MQATSRSKQFVVDHRIVTVAAAIVVLIAVTGGAALLLTTPHTSQGSDAQTVDDAQQRQRRMDRQDYADWPQLRAVRMSQSDLDRTGQLDPFYEAKMAHRDALETQASGPTNLPAWPGHAGFTDPAMDGVATAIWTYLPGQPGFIEP